MQVRLNVNGIERAEKTAREILEHVEAIKKLYQDAGWRSVEVVAEVVPEE